MIINVKQASDPLYANIEIIEEFPPETVTTTYSELIVDAISNFESEKVEVENECINLQSKLDACNVKAQQLDNAISVLNSL